MKRVKKGPTPLMGRQLFRGQYAPLILANNSGASPDVYAGVYSTATQVDPNTNVPVPVAPGMETCRMSTEEIEWCAYWPDLPFCRKEKIPKGDPQCEILSDPALKPECPMSDLLKKVCLSGPGTAYSGPFYHLTDFCTLNKINGMCVDDVGPEQKEMEDENIRKQKEVIEKEKENEPVEIRLLRTCLRIKKDGKVIQDLCPVDPSIRKEIDNFGVSRDIGMGNYLEFYRMDDETYRRYRFEYGRYFT